MKTLKFLNQEFKAEKIIKGQDYIIGKNEDIEVFKIKGIKDFTQFKLLNNEVFDEELTVNEQISMLTLKNARTEQLLKEQQELTSSLMKQIAQMKGANANV